jgi:hypothetical protein
MIRGLVLGLFCWWLRLNALLTETGRRVFSHHQYVGVCAGRP